jgi:hypothetical protein
VPRGVVAFLPFADAAVDVEGRLRPDAAGFEGAFAVEVVAGRAGGAAPAGLSPLGVLFPGARGEVAGTVPFA